MSLDTPKNGNNCDVVTICVGKFGCALMDVLQHDQAVSINNHPAEIIPLSLQETPSTDTDVSIIAGRLMAILERITVHQLAAEQNGMDRPVPPQVVVVAHSAEPDVFPFLLNLFTGLIGALPKYLSYQLTLLLGTDSRSGEQTNDIQKLLDTLKTFSINERLDWLYLIDSIDGQGRPMPDYTLFDKISSGYAQFQVDTACEFILALQSGLAAMPDYQKSCFSTLRQAYRNRPDGAIFSTFGSHCVIHRAKQERAAQGYTLLTQAIRQRLIGQGVPGLALQASLLANTLLNECQLRHTAIAFSLSHELGGRPLEFVVEPPSLHSMRNSQIVDTLAVWESTLESRWKQPAAAPARMDALAVEINARVENWLDHHVDHLLQAETGGVTTASLLVQQLRDALEFEQAAPIASQRMRPSWIANLKFLLCNRKPEPTMENLEKLRSELAAALENRLDLRKMLKSIARGFFFPQPGTYRAALPAFLRIPGLVMLLALSFMVPFVLIFPIVVFLAGLGGPALHAIILFAQAEWKYQRALNRFIQTVRRNYTRLQAEHLLREVEQVYSHISTKLDSCLQQVENRKETLLEAERLATQEVRDLAGFQPRLTQSETGDKRNGQFLLEDRTNILRALTRGYLASPDRSSWQTETASQIVACLKEAWGQIETDLRETGEGPDVEDRQVVDALVRSTQNLIPLFPVNKIKQSHAGEREVLIQRVLEVPPGLALFEKYQASIGSPSGGVYHSRQRGEARLLVFWHGLRLMNVQITGAPVADSCESRSQNEVA